MIFKRIITLSCLVTSVLSAAEGETYSSVEKAPPGKHKIALYGWLPAIDADSTVDGDTAPIDFSAKDILDNAEGAVFTRYEYLRHDNIGYYADFQWVNITGDSTVGPLDIDADIEQITVDLGAFYRLNLKNGAFFDSMLGIRYVDLKQKVNIDGPGPIAKQNLGGSEDWVEPVIGARLGLPMTETLTFLLRGDYGGFGVGSAADKNYNVVVATEWAFDEQWSTIIGWKYNYLDYSRGSGDDKFGFDGSFAGVIAAITYSF
jgi:hypothetical protein